MFTVSGNYEFRNQMSNFVCVMMDESTKSQNLASSNMWLSNKVSPWMLIDDHFPTPQWLSLSAHSSVTSVLTLIDTKFCFLSFFFFWSLQEEFDEFRALSYAHTDVFLLCFSMVNPDSFHNITKKWVSDIRAHNPSAPIVLVGTQSDLLLDVNVLINLDRSNVKPVLSSRARSMAEKIRAADYIECSSLTQKNLKEAFDAAIFAAIKNKTRKSKKRRFSDRRTKAFSRCSWKKFFCFIWTHQNVDKTL